MCSASLRNDSTAPSIPSVSFSINSFPHLLLELFEDTGNDSPKQSPQQTGIGQDQELSSLQVPLFTETDIPVSLHRLENYEVAHCCQMNRCVGNLIFPALFGKEAEVQNTGPRIDLFTTLRTTRTLITEI